MSRLLILWMITLAGCFALGAAEYEYDSNPVCGKYSATNGGGVIEIVPYSHVNLPIPEDLKFKYSLTDQYVIILEDNPSPMLEPGTIMGWIAPLAKPGMFSGTIYTKEKDGRLVSPRKFLMEMNADGTHLSMLEIRHRLRLEPLRFLPYLFHGISLKGTLRMEDNRRDDVEGFIKFFPRPVNPFTPRQL